MKSLVQRGILLATAVMALAACRQVSEATAPEKPRIVVTTDPELDDLNSLLRFLLYSTDFQVEGLVYASSQFHWKGDGKGTKHFVPGREYTRFGLDICPCESWRWKEGERFIHEAVEAYAKVYPNLKVHDPDYPDPEYLLSKIRYGNIEFDGDISRDSPGSELIRTLALDSVPGKLYLGAWGGQSTIARALKSIQDEYEGSPGWAELHRRISEKLVIMPFGDQDDTYGNYIQPNWPGIAYHQVTDGPNYGYGAQLRASATDSLYLTADWIGTNIRRGPMGDLYRVWGDGKQMVEGDIFDFFGLTGYTAEELREQGYVVWMPLQEPGSFLSEGDTGTYMNLLDNGLRAGDDPAFGGWGGRVSADEPIAGEIQVRPEFFPAVQRDFASRVQWSVTPKYEDANHPPNVSVEGALERSARPGETIRFQARVSDPDEDAVSLRWYAHTAGRVGIPISQHAEGQAAVQLPEATPGGETVYVILEATDSGSPAITRYARVTVNVAGE